MQTCSSLPLHTRYSIISLTTLSYAREGISYHLTAKRSHMLRLLLTPGLLAAAQLPQTYKGVGIRPESAMRFSTFSTLADQLFYFCSPLLLSWHFATGTAHLCRNWMWPVFLPTNLQLQLWRKNMSRNCSLLCSLVILLPNCFPIF